MCYLFKKILIFNIIFFIIIILLFYFSNLLYSNNKIYNNYEFGSNLIGYNKGFSINFCLLGFLFLLFDAELILFIPWILFYNYFNIYIYIIIFFLTFFILLMLFYELYKSILNWYLIYNKSI